ncbi:hypothetical protein CASFOL_042659 [Castilleja foliolosa]|uniref:Late embryogenesis abundant protein LEA-2 subgroup domain-containing protein n=1 Tax=Castilleja foliolosa TaxID=1961234 RepID=A0ABD3B8A9_9LAMI
MADHQETIIHHQPQSPVPNMTQFEKHHQEEDARPAGSRGYDHPRRRAICSFLVILLILAAVTFLILWLLYRPHKPKFRVVSAAIYDLNITSPNSISTTMQFTVVTRNPNRRVKFHYDHLSAFVAYKNQAITPPVILPPLFHETKSTVALSPMIGGVAVPAAADVVNGLVMEEGYGVVELRLVVNGRLRYKAAGGVRVGGWRGVYVRCDMFVGVKNGFVGQVPLLASQPCSVDV